jgi:hypothetical protein
MRTNGSTKEEEMSPPLHDEASPSSLVSWDGEEGPGRSSRSITSVRLNGFAHFLSKLLADCSITSELKQLAIREDSFKDVLL